MRYKEMEEKDKSVVSYEVVEKFILDQINTVHMYRMAYFRELRNEQDWDNYLHDNMEDGYKLIKKAIDKYLFIGCPLEFNNEILAWYHSSLEMLKDFRELLIKKYNKKYIRSTIRGFITAYNREMEELEINTKVERNEVK